MFAHVAGVPVEELLPLTPALAAGAGLLLVHARNMAARLTHRRSGRHRSDDVRLHPPVERFDATRG